MSSQLSNAMTGTTEMEMDAVQTAKSNQDLCAEGPYARGSVGTGKSVPSLGKNATTGTMKMETGAAAYANYKVDLPAW